MIDGGLSNLLQRHLPGWHWQRIETGGTGLGIPDLNYCRRGVEGWLELKRADGWKVGVSPEQVGWAERRVREGGRVTMGVRQGGSGRDVLWLVRPDFIRSLRSGLRLDLLPASGVLLRSAGGPLSWDWEQVAKVLTRAA